MAQKLIVAIALLGALGGARLGAQNVPDTLVENGAPAPLWVAADVALGSDGSPRADLFSPVARGDIEAMLDLPVDHGCIRVGKILVDQRTGDQDRTNLDAALRSAHVITIARVVASRSGFFQGIPGQLVAVEPEQVYKGAGGPIYYEFFPVGTLKLHGRQLCKTDDEYEVPTVGEQQLVTGNTPFGSAKNILIPVTPGDFVKVGADGRVAFPKRYVQSDPSLANVSIDSVRAILKGRIGPERER